MDQIKETFSRITSFLTAQYSLWPRSLDQHSQETPRVLQVLLSIRQYETHYDPNLIQGDRVQYEQSEAADLPRVFRDKVSYLKFFSRVTHRIYISCFLLSTGRQVWGRTKWWPCWTWTPCSQSSLSSSPSTSASPPPSSPLRWDTALSSPFRWGSWSTAAF